MRTMVCSLGVALVLASNAVKAADSCAAPLACSPAAADADDPGGLGPCTRKVCKVVVEMKTVKKHVWVCECEEHCTGLPGSGLFSRCCDGSDPAVCEASGGGCDPCSAFRSQPHFPPKCGEVRHRKVLKKKEIECQVPTYKCVVVCEAAGRPGACSCGNSTPANEPVVTSRDPMQNAPLPPVVGTSYLK